MSTYAIGDLQGCFYSFQHLLDDIQFDPDHDTLWLVGDLINRGNGSLEVLRWIQHHQACVVAVLGNHDLHTLVVAEGIAPPHRSDTLQALLEAPDRDQLLYWLRQQPLLHVAQEYVMVHAGLLPQWTVAQAQALASEVEQALRGSDYKTFLRHMYGNQPALWQDDLQGMDRLRAITNALTRLRLVDAEGGMEFHFKGELDDIPSGYLPWFEVSWRQSQDHVVLFGHWSALGLQQRPGLYALDTGCLWGGKLTALRLQDRQLFQVDCDPRDSRRSIKRDR